MSYDLVKALKSLYPGSVWSLNGDSYAGFAWSEDNVDPKPTEAELIAECVRLEQLYVSLEYQRQRKLSYPGIEDQLDLLYHGGYDAWKTVITEIKNQYPKDSV
jgi:hypothetical protein